MKKSLFYLFMLMAVAAMPLTSCEKDPQKDEEHDSKSDSDLTEVTAYNSLSWLQGALVVVNEKGEIIRRVYGEPLDESQPDVLSAPVGSYATAEKIFLSWVAPGKTATKVDGGYDYNLTDAEGKAQGSVSFRSVEDGGRVIARMTVAEGTELAEVSEVNFIDSKLWPENAAPWETVKEGDVLHTWDGILTWEDGFFIKTGRVAYYTLQGNTDGKVGIQVHLCPDENDSNLHPKPTKYWNDAVLQYLPSEWEAQQVLDIFNNNRAAWDKMMETMASMGYNWYPQEGSGTTGNAEFIINCESDWHKASYLYCLDLDDDDSDGIKGSIRAVNVLSLYKYRYMRVKVYNPVN
ncbi:MAG: hypothetical protein IKW11_06365 [Bacteroidales bacterium]|nr:hypothetical protein [Bacteroidales bacterium]